MHDAAAAYDRDTYVVDVDDRPSTPRVATEDLTMQVYLEKWHRRIPTLSHTACGKPIHGEFCDTRREQLNGDLCVDCFTGYELTLAATNNRKDQDP